MFEDNNYVNVVNKTQKILSLTGKTSYYSGECILLNLKPNTQYTIKTIATIIGTNCQGKIFIHNKNYNGSGAISTENRIAVSNTATAPGGVLCAFTTDKTGIVYILFQCNHNTNNGSITYENIQLEEGAIASSFEPYYHQDYPLNLGSLELCKIGNYQDYLYKENGNWYKYEAIGKDILTDTDNWEINTSSSSYIVYKRTKATLLSNLTNGYCNYFIVTTRSSGIVNLGNVIRCGPGDNNVYYVVVQLADYPNLNTLNNWLSWLENHNIVFYGALRTSTTTQITDETLISQLDAIYEYLQLVKGTNNISVTASDLAPYMELSYMQDLPTKLNKIDELESRLALLE